MSPGGVRFSTRKSLDCLTAILVNNGFMPDDSARDVSLSVLGRRLDLKGGFGLEQSKIRISSGTYRQDSTCTNRSRETTKVLQFVFRIGHDILWLLDGSIFFVCLRFP